MSSDTLGGEVGIFKPRLVPHLGCNAERTENTSVSSFRSGNHPADLGVLPRLALSFLSHTSRTLAYTEIALCKQSYYPPPSPTCCTLKMIPTRIQVPPYTFEYQQIPFTALKYNLHERLKGLSLQRLCHFCEVLLVLSFLQSKDDGRALEPMHPDPHISPPELIIALSKEGRGSPKMTLSVCPSSQVHVSLRTAYKQ